MPKSRDSGRSKSPAGQDPPARPIPDREEVERAIESIVDRLKPKPPKPKSSQDKQGLASKPRLRVVGRHPGIR